ncbi:MAG: hypothetical protein ACLUIO_06885 [Neglectibacter timonensis]
MKTKMKRLLAVALCAAMAVSAGACSGADSGSSEKTSSAGSQAVSAAAGSSAPQPMRYVAPGSDWPMQDEVIAKVNEKLQADGVNIEVKLQRIPWDAWDQKTQLMISSGEEFEMLHVMGQEAGGHPVWSGGSGTSERAL